MEPMDAGPTPERPPAPIATLIVAPHRRLARRWRGGGPGIGAPVYRTRRRWPEALGLAVFGTAYLVARYVPGSGTPVHPTEMGWMKWGLWGILAFFALWLASTPYDGDSVIGRRLRRAAIVFGVAPVLARFAGWI